MKNIIVTSVFALFAISIIAQETEKSKLGWFISPEFGGIFHDDHLGRTVGISLGVKLFNDHLKLGVHAYGRSGPINSEKFFIEASEGQSYKGSTTLRLKADHGVFGIFIAPTFTLKKIRIDLPITIGQIAAGYYLTGSDRETPDGRRVSEWEDQLMDGEDAGFGGAIEFGSRVFFPTKNKHLSIGAGLHYTLAPGWETYFDPSGDFYNNRLRFSLVVNFESKK